jgi:hypothetical protein
MFCKNEYKIGKNFVAPGKNGLLDAMEFPCTPQKVSSGGTKREMLSFCTLKRARFVPISHVSYIEYRYPAEKMLLFERSFRDICGNRGGSRTPGDSNTTALYKLTMHRLNTCTCRHRKFDFRTPTANQ